MYSREILPPPKKLIKNGQPIFGTFEGYPDLLDIRGVRTPFSHLHLPHIFTDIRIRSTISVSFELGDYIGAIHFFDEKIFAFAEAVFWNRTNGRKFTYRTLMGPRRRFIPHELNCGYCTSFSKRRYIRISWDHKRNRLSIVFKFKGDSTRPDCYGALTGHFSDTSSGEITTVIPYPTKRRCSATYTASSNIHGTLFIGKTKLTDEQNITTNGTVLFKLNRSYYNVYNLNETICATGTLNGKNVTFTFSQPKADAIETDLYNENFLIVDGNITPLPSIKMTQPMGVTDKWIIQDTENMVDLTFTPISDNFRELSFIAMYSRIHTIYGKFEGSLKTKDDEIIELDGFEGIAKKLLMRL